MLGVGLLARLFAVALAIAQHGPKWLFTRGMEVGFVANSLLTGHGFSSPFGGNTGPTALIAPGYPLLVAGAFKLFGAYSTTSALMIILAQVLLNLATIALMMYVANTIAGGRGALIAGLFWACWPPLLWMPTIFWETSLSAFALLGMLSLAWRLSTRPTRALWSVFGLLSGLIVLTNMALLISLCAVYVWLGIKTFRTLKQSMALAMLLFLLTFSAWPVRNAEVFHAFVPLRTTVGLELWMGNHDGASGYLEESMFPMYNSRELAQYQRDGELAYDHEKSIAAQEWIAAHPATFAKLTLLRVIRFWIGSGSRNGSPVFVLGAVATSLCGFWGLLRLYQRRRLSLAILFAIPLVLFPLPYYISHAEFRYRLVLDPLLTLLSAYALTTYSQRDSQHTAIAPSEPIDRLQEHLVG